VLGSFIVVGLENSKNDEVLAEETVVEEDQAGIQLRLSSEIEEHTAATADP